MAGIFANILQILFDLLALVFLLRVLLEYFNVDYYNPLSIFTDKVTSPVLTPIQRFIPRYRKLNIAGLVMLVVIQLLKLSMLGLFFTSIIKLNVFLIPTAILQSINFILNFYFFAVLLRVVVSWLSPYNYNPVISVLYQITEPLMLPARKIIKPISGFDFSPILVILGLQVAGQFANYMAAKMMVIY